MTTMTDDEAYEMIGQIADRITCCQLPQPIDSDDPPCDSSRLIEVVDCQRDRFDESGWCFVVSCSACDRTGIASGLAVA